MNNYPDYSSKSSNDLVPGYSRKQISTSSEHEFRRQQLYRDQDFYKYNSHTNRLQSPDAFPPNENSRLPSVGHGSLNEDSNIYRHTNRERYGFQREQDRYNNQRYPDTERSYQHPFLSDRNLSRNLLRNGQNIPEKDSIHDSFSFASHSQNREIYSDGFRSSFSEERKLLLDGYTDRNRSSITNQKNFPSHSLNPSDEDYSNSLSSLLLAQKASFSDASSSNNMSVLSKGEEILKEIKILQQQQKLQELLNVSLSIAKHIKHSPVLQDVDKESLSNNNSSTKPEIFPEQRVSEQRFQNDTQLSFKFDNDKAEISNNYSQSPSFDNLWSPSDDNIPFTKSSERKLPFVNEQKCLSFSNIPCKLISENEVTTSNVTSEVDRQMTDPFDKVLPSTLDISSMNNSISKDNSSASEWSKTHFIPFFGETADSPDSFAVDRLSPRSLIVEQPVNSDSSQNKNISGDDKEIVKSSLEDALEKLEIMDPVIGLDFIIENKRSVSVDGSFPFQCKLCNASITRPLIIDHILGTKHRIRFVKIKDEDLYNHIMGPLIIQTDKEEAIYKAAHKMEKKYGRGRVVVQDKLPTKVAKSASGIKITFGKIEDHTNPVAFELDNENDLEKIKTSGDVNIKSESSATPNDNSKTSSKVLTPIVETPCPVSSPGNNNFKFSKQVSSNESEINHVSVKTEPSIAASFLDQKVTVESALSSNSNDGPTFSLSLKRPATPLADVPSKHIKTDQKSCKTEVESVFCDNSLHNDSELSKASFFRSSTPLISPSIAEKQSLTRLLGQMSKWEISSPEEAEMVSETVDVLLKLLLRYKLQQEAGNDVENVMKSFLSTYLEKSNKHSDSTKKFDLPLEGIGNTLVTKDNYNTIDSTSEVSTMEVVENKDSNQTNPSPPNKSNSNETSKFLSNTETASPKSSDKSLSGLQPPPFFSWTKSNTPPASTAPSSAPVPSVAMSWSSPYGSNLGYYQQQGYGSVPSMYQPYTLPMAHCAPPVALPVPPVPITPASIVPPFPPPSIDRPQLPLSFGLPPPPPPTEPPLPPLPPSENIPPAPSSKLLPPLPPPLPSKNQSPGPSHKLPPPLPTCVPPPPPPLN